MFLLDTITLNLKEFFDEQVPKYAILSHRWEEEEVLFQDMKDGAYQSKKGYLKLKGACDQAARDMYQWIWIDTCCIDKSSSAELSEAINSMFRWYEASSVCYAYLSDVPCHQYHETSRTELAFEQSKWFTRGWTLQELIAPATVIFFNSEWSNIGTKEERAKTISEMTGIQDHVLTHNGAAFDCSVAQKMSWLSRRITTRTEDIAYCMLGLFKVHMSPLYGEGGNAFQRLQLEILKITDDESIFAWKTDLLHALREPKRGLLALSASEFETCGNIRRWDARECAPYSMTNKGLAIQFVLKPRSYSRHTNRMAGGHQAYTIYAVALNCVQSNTASRYVEKMGIYLMRYSDNSNAFGRIFPNYNISPDVSFERPAAFFGTVPDPPDTMNWITIPSSQTVYVRPQPPLLSGGVPRFREIKITGSRLQSKLSEIISIDTEEHWVEHLPFHFLQHAMNNGYNGAPTAVILTRKSVQERPFTFLRPTILTDDRIAILFYFKDNEPITKVVNISADTIDSWQSLRTFLTGPKDEEHIVEIQHGLLQAPSPWYKSGWSAYVPEWNGILRLELSHPLKYTMNLSGRD